MVTSQSEWFLKSLSLRGSIFGVVFPRAFLFGVLAIAVAVLHQYQPELPWDFGEYLINNVALNLILGLLLVFRTNTAYERFWEGRKAWDEIIANIRTLLREIHDTELENTEAAEPKQTAMVWLVALAIATKGHLRENLKEEQFESLLTKVEWQKINASANAPMLILQWLNYFTHEHINVVERIPIQEKFTALTNGVTSCERILNTPLPFAYAIFLRKLILLYCFCLPFGLVQTLQWGSIPITLPVSFVLLGVEAIAEEIEDPFGKDENDLPLEELCQMLTKEAQEFNILQEPQESVGI